MRRETGVKTNQGDPARLRALEEKTLQNAEIRKDGFSLDLSGDPAGWDRLIRELGRRAAYAHMSQVLCRAFFRQNGRDLIFTEACVAYELGWHANAYLWTQGFRGCHRHILTWLFSKAALERHCRSVEIDEKDLHNLRQRLVFHYKRGLRK